MWIPGPPAKLPGLLLIGAFTFALSLYLWGPVVTILLIVLLAQFWLAWSDHGKQGKYRTLLIQIRKGMDEKGMRELDETMAAETRYPDLWWPLVLTTLAAGVVTVYRGIIFGLPFLPILFYMVYRIRRRVSFVKNLEETAEKELVADVH